MLVGGVVVNDQVHIQSLGHTGVDVPWFAGFCGSTRRPFHRHDSQQRDHTHIRERVEARHAEQEYEQVAEMIEQGLADEHRST